MGAKFPPSAWSLLAEPIVSRRSLMAMRGT